MSLPQLELKTQDGSTRNRYGRVIRIEPCPQTLCVGTREVTGASRSETTRT